MAEYRIGSKITHELLEGEVIAIHFDTGAYYSLRGSAARIWECLAASAGNAPAIAATFEGDASEVGNAVDVFLRSLAEEGLIDEQSASSESVELDDTVAKLPFETPVFERFEDMRDLLLADPIHEVDDEGWPHVKA